MQICMFLFLTHTETKHCPQDRQRHREKQKLKRDKQANGSHQFINITAWLQQSPPLRGYQHGIYPTDSLRCLGNKIISLCVSLRTWSKMGPSECTPSLILLCYTSKGIRTLPRVEHPLSDDVPELWKLLFYTHTRTHTTAFIYTIPELSLSLYTIMLIS